MSRRIGEDFAAFSGFLKKYNLKSFSSEEKQIEIYKAMHKKLYGLLIFVAEFKLQKVSVSSEPFLTETTSDLLLSLFCTIQGMYKPAKLQLRCSIENLLKALIIISDPHIVEEKSVYEIFNAAKNDRHFSTQFGTKRLVDIQNDYATLCRTVHGDPTVMHPISALQFLPQYEEILLKELSVLYIRIIEGMLGVLYLNYPVVIDMMHPQNHEDFLACMAKSAKKEIIKELFG